MDEEAVVDLAFEILVTDVFVFETLATEDELLLSDLDVREEEVLVEVVDIDEKEPHDDMEELSEDVAVLARKKYRHGNPMVGTAASLFLPATCAVGNCQRRCANNEQTNRRKGRTN